MTINFSSLNIEGKEHLGQVTDFLQQTKPDIFCAQEIMESDFQPLADRLGYQVAFAPMYKIANAVPDKKGLAIFTQGKLQHISRHYYGDFLPGRKPLFHLPSVVIPKDCVIISADCWLGDTNFTIANTHFSWTPDGEVDDNQRQNLTKLLEILKDYPEIILCGDFNSPRGKEIFDRLASQYQDNIPSAVTTTIDPKLHRAGPLQLVVDGLFTSPPYAVTDVRLLTGLSDHCAVVGTIIK